MSSQIPKRKTRSDKFPLTLHPTGQYCKKIKGKVYYFGADKQKALQRYLEDATYLHSGRKDGQDLSMDNVTIGTLCNAYLEHQVGRVQSGELTAPHYTDQVNCLRQFVHFLGQCRVLNEISSLDLQNYRRKLIKSYASAHRTNLNISIIKAMFHWAKKNELVTNIPNIDVISKIKVTPVNRPVFTTEQIQKLLMFSDHQMKAMIWLGLNCGFGCTDCAELRWNDLDMGRHRVKLARKKTGINRNLPLWQDTIAAIKDIPETGEHVFCTCKGNRWVRVIENVDKDGVVKYTADNAVSKEFSKLMKKAGIKAEKGVGFYTLRRTAATVAARSGDPFAVQKLLGHADLKMASVYVQDVSEQTDRVINNSRKFILEED